MAKETSVIIVHTKNDYVFRALLNSVETCATPLQAPLRGFLSATLPPATNLAGCFIRQASNVVQHERYLQAV